MHIRLGDIKIQYYDKLEDFWCIFSSCAQSYGTTLQYVAIFCNILHKWYYWHVKKSVILIIAYPSTVILEYCPTLYACMYVHIYACIYWLLDGKVYDVIKLNYICKWFSCMHVDICIHSAAIDKTLHACICRSFIHT